MPPCRALMRPEPSHPMNLRTMIRPRTRTEKSPTSAHRRPPSVTRRPALYLSAAAAGALLVNVLAAGEPAAQADGPMESVSIAEQLGITGDSSSPIDAESVAPLEQLAASRAERDEEQAAAAAAQAAAEE